MSIRCNNSNSSPSAGGSQPCSRPLRGRAAAGRASSRQKTRRNRSGSIVRVGFLRLRVLCSIPTPGDYRPDVYALESVDGRSFYRFTPHNGITRVNDRWVFVLYRGDACPKATAADQLTTT